MLRIMIPLLASSLFLFNGCASISPEGRQKTEVEEVINKKDLPPQVSMALPGEYQEKGFTFKRKLKDGAISYDAYYEKGGDQFTINYDEQGRVLKEEKKIRLSDIPHDIRIKIEEILSIRYPGYKVLMVERLYANNERLLEIFFSHPKSRTGLVEAVFEFETGTLREFINIQMKSISTMN